jgi:2',3'-cyclic-nucleotide 2'-phosphodiesterase (5'-nucleotidase family)
MISPPRLIIPRRRFLQSLAGSAAALALPRGAWGAEGDGRTVTVSILNTTDLHGHIMPAKTYEGEENVGGLARCATQIRAWQKENPNNILLDIGDVYQGTHVSRATGGSLMIDLFNRLNYDAWVIGNHEFDWGLDTLTKCITASKMNVLAANAQAGGKWTNTLEDKSNPLAKVAPYFIREVAGFRIGIIGAVTPGLPAWLNPSLLREFSAADPVGSVKFAIRRLKAEKVDAIVLACHFGIKGIRDGKGTPDDFANRVHEITRECRDISVVIAGHTHRDIGVFRVNDIPYTQASYYGIHAGRTDLVFDKDSRKLLDVKVNTVRMEKNIEFDPMIISASTKDIQASDAELKREIGELAEPLSCKGAPGETAPSLRLIQSAIRHSLEKRGQKVDGVLHGLFLDEMDLTAGKKTIADAWEIIPYENRLATVELTGAELSAVVEETKRARFSTHGLSGFKLAVSGEGEELKVTSLTLPDGQPADPTKRYRIALNGFDAQSGGRRYPQLAKICAAAEAKLTLHDIESRDAVIEFFTEKKTVRAAALAG